MILERIAKMALGTFQLNPEILKLPDYISEKHYQRKHGPNAYYGQKGINK
jgi:ribulose-5-phosphate 4-epimerase/fuculose-1-phosphate aldolase